MAVLIVEYSGKRSRAALEARTSIGRTPDNDVVVEHPAVSRTHAIIDCVDQTFFISDNGSKNGTVVGEHPLVGKLPLVDGDRIAIGPAILTFRLTDDFIEQPGQSTLSETHAGVLMDCECGAKLWVPKEMVGGRGQCQKCGRTLTLGPNRSASSAPTTIRTCSICQWKIEAAEPKMVCPACGLVFHQDCWNENRGCSAYGCSQVNILDKPEEVDAVMEEIGHPPAVDLSKQQRFPWEFALLAGSVVGSVLGLLVFGTLALAMMLTSGMYLLKHGRNARVPVVLAAMVICLVGLIAGVVVSCFWWTIKFRY